MPRTITIQDAIITQVNILPIEVGFQIRIGYNLRDETQQVVMSKTSVHYSASATIGGRPLTPKLPDAMEGQLGLLLAAFQDGVTKLEDL